MILLLRRGTDLVTQRGLPEHCDSHETLANGVVVQDEVFSEGEEGSCSSSLPLDSAEIEPAQIKVFPLEYYILSCFGAIFEMGCVIPGSLFCLK